MNVFCVKGKKKIVWDLGFDDAHGSLFPSPTLAQVLGTVQKEFPEKALGSLEVTVESDYESLSLVISEPDV